MIIEDPKEQFESKPNISIHASQVANGQFNMSPKASPRDKMSNSFERKQYDSLAMSNLLHTNRNFESAHKDQVNKTSIQSNGNDPNGNNFTDFNIKMNSVEESNPHSVDNSYKNLIQDKYQIDLTEKQVSDEIVLIKFKAGNVGSYNKQIVFEKSDYVNKLFNDKQNPRDFNTEITNPIEFQTSFNKDPKQNDNTNSPNETPRQHDQSNNTSSFNNSISKTSVDEKQDIHLHEIHKEIFDDIQLFMVRH